MTNEMIDALVYAYTNGVDKQKIFNKLQPHISLRDAFVSYHAFVCVIGKKYKAKTKAKVLKEYMVAADRYLPKDFPSALNMYLKSIRKQQGLPEQDSILPIDTNSIAFLSMELGVSSFDIPLTSIYTFPAEDATS